VVMREGGGPGLIPLTPRVLHWQHHLLSSVGKQQPVNSTSMSQRRARDLLSLGCFPPSPSQGVAQFGPNVRSPESTPALGFGTNRAYKRRWGNHNRLRMGTAHLCSQAGGRRAGFNSAHSLGPALATPSAQFGWKAATRQFDVHVSETGSRPPVARLLSVLTFAGCCTIRTQRPFAGINPGPWVRRLTGHINGGGGTTTACARGRFIYVVMRVGSGPELIPLTPRVLHWQHQLLGSVGKQQPVNSTSMSQRRARDLLSLGCFPPSPSQGVAQFGPNVRSSELNPALGFGD